MGNRFGLRSLGVSLLLATAAACAAPGEESQSLERQVLELDDMGTAPASMELFVLSEDASLAAVREVFAKLHGTFVHHLPPRLVVGKVPAGADALLREVGVLARHARAVSPDELPGLDVREARFVRVFSSRYYPETTRAADLVRPTRAVRVPGAPFELAEPPLAPQLSALRASLESDEGAEQLERNVFVPYASGRIVVSVVLPESNGRGEPDTESWSDEAITQVYAKVQAGLEAIARHEPNNQLDFVLHYESAPANGGLEGTVDVDWEYGKQASSGMNLGQAYAQIFSRLTGRTWNEWDYWQGQSEYLAGLKDRYAADGAFIVYVAANQNGTAGFRAYAYLNGPSTSLDSSYGFEVFAHEFGHIFGALDEYCPDACIPPSSLAGYLGVVNANAQYRAGQWGGIRGGKGEGQGSLMMYNVANGVNGYTRGAWGWLDTDGDGVIEVRDTLPSSNLRAEVLSSEVRLVGRVVDVPATPNWATPYSANRIRALHVRKAGQGSWVRLPITSDRRGREDVNLALGALAAGHYELEVRAENSVGNLEPKPQRVSFDVTGEHASAAPLVALSADVDVLSPSGWAGVTASALDLDGESVEFRFDVDGDGHYDTDFSPNRTVWVEPTRAGITLVGVEARDARGLVGEAWLPLYVFEGNAPALPGLPAAPTPLIGSYRARLQAVGEVHDPERANVELNYKLERDDYLRSLVSETGFGMPRAHVYDVETPESLVSTALDLNALDWTIDRWTYVYDAVRYGSYVAFALGEQGLAFVDLANPSAPRLVGRLSIEAYAYDLNVSGSTLFVAGNNNLTVVDLTNPEAPVEILQAEPTYNTRLLQSWQAWPIEEGAPQPLSLWAGMTERIGHVQVDLELVHPNWAELRISLTGPRGEHVVLWDHQPQAEGQHVLSVSDSALPALRELIGGRASGQFTIEVSDDVINGVAGTMPAASITLTTYHRAFQPRSSSQNIVGAVSGALLLAGAALETVDLTELHRLRSLQVLESEWIQKAELVGSRVVGLTAPQEPSSDGRLRGLFAIDASVPSALRVLRTDASVQANAGFASAGSRLYVSSYWPDMGTRIGSLPAFLAGSSYWLGQTTHVLGSDLSGDDSAIWVAHGPLERFDVRNPASVTLLERFDDPAMYATRFFDARTALSLGSAGELTQVDLAARAHLVSEVYRLTAQARDAQGAVSETSRTVHVVPYDHAPSVQAARLVAGARAGDYFQFELSVFDPDNRPSWDTFVAVRADWDADGIYDGPWLGIWDNVQIIGHVFEEPGDYPVRFQARDGFHALSNEVVLWVHVEPAAPGAPL